MAEENQEIRRVFISYSWTSPEHQQGVIELAERLMSDRIDVVLDVWELTEGQDKYAFMEKMVTDKSINKVLALCDKRYAEKADGREGGVGTESQIISREVYESADQKKFIPIVTEYYEDGQPCLPTYFKSRIYIDMSSMEKLNKNYEKLVRNIYDKPLYKKPSLGKPPSYILEDERIPSRTRSKLQAFKEAVSRGRGQVIVGLAADYLGSYSEALEDFRLEPTHNDTPLNARVISSINQMLPCRDEFIDFVTYVIRYANQDEIHEEIHRNFEVMLQYTAQQVGANYGASRWVDNFQFLLRELFLYLIAALIKKEKSKELEIYLERSYFYSPSNRDGGGYNAPYSVFDLSITSLDEDSRTRRNQPSVSARLVRERATNPNLNFDWLMQTDFILGLRSFFNSKDFSENWYPRTMVYAEPYRTFSLFARASSKRYFEFLKGLLKIEDKNDLIEKSKNLEQSYHFTRGPGSMGFEKIMNIGNLDTSP